MCGNWLSMNLIIKILIWNGRHFSYKQLGDQFPLSNLTLKQSIHGYQIGTNVNRIDTKRDKCWTFKGQLSVQRQNVLATYLKHSEICFNYYPICEESISPTTSLSDGSHGHQTGPPFGPDWHLTLRKIVIRMSKNCQNHDIFFQKIKCQKWSFF